MIYGEKFLTEAKEINHTKERIVQSTINALNNYIKANNLKCNIERTIYGTLAQISNNNFLKGNGTKYTYYVLSKDIKTNTDVYKLIKNNKEELANKIESATHTKIVKVGVVNPADTVLDGSWYITVKITYEI